MENTLVLYAVPIFLILILIEFLVLHKAKKDFYEIKDFTSNVSSGILEQMISIPMQALTLLGYHAIYLHWALFTIRPDSILSWVFLWFAVDFFYYCYHRATHRVAFLWMGHSVHHQSEYYNLSVALRQGVVQTIFAYIIFFPLALLGFPTWMVVTVYSLNLLYQFWLHTQTIHRMGWLEAFLNTPSHHRVHHGKNDKYIDKNFAGSLIIWDKMFGTFEPEGEPVDYGVTEPLETWNPFYANIKVAMDLMYYGQFLKNFAARAALFLQPPEKIVELLGITRFTQVKRQARRNAQEVSASYLLFNLMFLIGNFIFYIINLEKPGVLVWVFALNLVLTLWVMGLVCNVQGKVKWLEWLRTLALAASIYLWTQSLALALGLGLLFYGINYKLVNLRFRKEEVCLN